jgi:hypothetical protein
MPRAAQAWESATGFAPAVLTGKRSSGEPAPRTGRVACRENNGMDLVDWIGRVPSSGEKRPSREQSPPSFRWRSIKLCVRTPAKSAPQGDRRLSGEWFARSRLEQRWEPGNDVLCAPGDPWMAADARVARRRASRPRRLRGMRRDQSRSSCATSPVRKAATQDPARIGKSRLFWPIHRHAKCRIRRVQISGNRTGDTQCVRPCPPWLLHSPRSAVPPRPCPSRTRPLHCPCNSGSASSSAR